MTVPMFREQTEISIKTPTLGRFYHRVLLTVGLVKRMAGRCSVCDEGPREQAKIGIILGGRIQGFSEIAVYTGEIYDQK